mmetsp:Transcript_35467/g.58094  ORF Transcript_35467/g.58094 Transcript_35467/m.58094 type:complete len:92 (-) Transcript_35467:43-318(-)
MPIRCVVFVHSILRYSIGEQEVSGSSHWVSATRMMMIPRATHGGNYTYSFVDFEDDDDVVTRCAGIGSHGRLRSGSVPLPRPCYGEDMKAN